jgi:hypothetical protein
VPAMWEMMSLTVQVGQSVARPQSRDDNCVHRSSSDRHALAKS